jgi:hypothetical protein
MHLPLTISRTARILRLAVLAAAILLPHGASAESAYIDQIGGANLPSGVGVVSPLARPAPRAGAMSPATSSGQLFARTPEAFASAAAANTALTLQSGINNLVAHVQNGKNNYSSVAVVSGQQNNVGVLQDGNGLRSQVMLVGTQGLNVGVIQPNASAPVNLFVARLPGGGLLIKR